MAKRHLNRIAIRWGLRAAVMALAIVLIPLTLATWSVYERERAASLETRATKAAHDELVARRAALEANLGALGTPRGIEAAIRERYPVVRPGEEVISFVDAPPAPAATTTPPAGIWDSVKNWLGL
jgi:cell division protein FtsB